MTTTGPAECVSTGYIFTYSGRKVDVLNFKTDDVNIRDIAQALCLIPRFLGHISRFYSVAQHSMAVASVVAPEHRKWALLHDAAEAYLGDCPRPYKKHLIWIQGDTSDASLLGDYSWREVESNILKVIADVFHLSWPMPGGVKIADSRMLETEAAQLKPGLVERLTGFEAYHDFHIHELPWKIVHAHFREALFQEGIACPQD